MTVLRERNNNSNDCEKNMDNMNTMDSNNKMINNRDCRRRLQNEMRRHWLEKETTMDEH